MVNKSAKEAFKAAFIDLVASDKSLTMEDVIDVIEEIFGLNEKKEKEFGGSHTWLNC